MGSDFEKTQKTLYNLNLFSDIYLVNRARSTSRHLERIWVGLLFTGWARYKQQFPMFNSIWPIIGLGSFLYSGIRLRPVVTKYLTFIPSCGHLCQVP